MKVICMSHENFANIPIDPDVPRPAIGEEVTVIGERVFKGSIDCYLLAEYTSPSPIYVWGYDKRNFSPLGTDLDETALVTEEFEEKYYEPVKR